MKNSRNVVEVLEGKTIEGGSGEGKIKNFGGSEKVG